MNRRKRQLALASGGLLQVTSTPIQTVYVTSHDIGNAEMITTAESLALQIQGTDFDVSSAERVQRIEHKLDEISSLLRYDIHLL